MPTPRSASEVISSTRVDFAPGDLAIVSKPGSSHDGYTVKILGITGTGRSYRVSLGNNAVRTYYTANLSPLD